MLRLDDFNQMKLMQKELTKLRKAKEKKKNAAGSSKTRQSDQNMAANQRPMSGVPQPNSQLSQSQNGAITSIASVTGSANNQNNQIRNRI